MNPVHEYHAFFIHPGRNRWALALLLALLLSPSAARAASDADPDPAVAFVHGVASGDPLADRVILWTRVDGLESTTEVTWQVAKEATFDGVIAQGTATASSEGDFTVKVDAAGLEPGTTYFYRFTCAGASSPTGRTRTLPAGETASARFGVVSCANYTTGYFNAYAELARLDDLNFVLHLGDYFYEHGPRSPEAGGLADRPHAPDRELISLEDYRTRHAQYKTDPDLQALHAAHPMIAIWDDHEIANDTWRDGAERHPADGSKGEWEARRTAAIRAYFEWMPIREPDPGAERQVYRAFDVGDLISFILLDTRHEGRSQPLSRDEAMARYDDPAHRLMSPVQEAWLFDELKRIQASGARWPVIAQQVMIGELMTPRGVPANPDQWDGYGASRDRLTAFLHANGIPNVVFLTGDLHSSWVNEIHDRASGEPVAMEFIAPGITSAFPPAAKGYISILANQKPLTKWADFNHSGYVTVEATPESLQTDWWFIERAVKGAKAEHAAQATLRRGTTEAVIELDELSGEP